MAARPKLTKSQKAWCNKDVLDALGQKWHVEYVVKDNTISVYKTSKKANEEGTPFMGFISIPEKETKSCGQWIFYSNAETIGEGDPSCITQGDISYDIDPVFFLSEFGRKVSELNRAIRRAILEFDTLLDVDNGMKWVAKEFPDAVMNPLGNPENKKYELTDETIEFNGHILHRIRAVRDITDPAFPDWKIKKYDEGGYIETEDNLSHEGAAWVINNAKVYGNAKVFGNAIISGGAAVYDNAKVYGEAEVYDTAKVYGDAKVYDDAMVGNTAEVYGNADVHGTWVRGDAKVSGDSNMSAAVEKNVKPSCKQDLPTKIAETFRQMAEKGNETKVTQRELDAYNGLLETLIKTEVPSATNIKRETLSQLELYAPADENDCDHRIYFTYDDIPFRIKSMGTKFWIGAGVKCPNDPKTYYGECSTSVDTPTNLGSIVLTLAAEWKCRFTPDNIPNDYDYDLDEAGEATDKKMRADAAQPDDQPSSDGDRLSQLETKVEKLAADMVDAQAKVKKIAKDMKGALSDIKAIKKKLKM